MWEVLPVDILLGPQLKVKIWIHLFIHLDDLLVEVRHFAFNPDLMDNFRDDLGFLPL